ncbi:MAG: hypothetical protein BMS9Abin05_2612 [Rhodothermia bacterium]|nr:MAG: hypothetical protein BMS9Abin05_2612 [Rhodothermia bacterium]
MIERKVSKSKSGRRRKRTLKEITIAGGQAERRYKTALKSRLELDWINETLGSPDGWLELVKLRKPDTDIRKLLETLRKRKEKLERALHRGKNPSKFVQTFQARARQRLPYEMRVLDLIYPGPSLSSWISALISANQQVDCPVFSIGQVPASDFRAYAWAGTSVNNAGTANAFWPLSQSNVFAQSTFTGDWSGETGANFWGWLDVPGTFWGFDLMDFVATAGVLQFTIPAPECDSILSWGTWGIAEAPTEWFINADLGRIDTEWVLHESPVGGGFPNSIMSFQFFSEGLLKSHTGATVTRDVMQFERSFEVKAGVSPKIYLGLSLGMLARDGEVSSIKVGGLGDHFEFEYGVTYIMVTKNP